MKFVIRRLVVVILFLLVAIWIFNCAPEYDLVYKYTRLKYLNVIKWPLFDGHTYSKKESKAARDFFAEYVIDMRDKENKEIWEKMAKLRK